MDQEMYRFLRNGFIFIITMAVILCAYKVKMKQLDIEQAKVIAVMATIEAIDEETPVKKGAW